MTDTEQEPQHLTISEAAEAAGVHRRAIRRCLDAGELPNAYRAVGPQGQRTWNIPVADLLAAGLQVHAPAGTNGEAATARNGQAIDGSIDLRHPFGEGRDGPSDRRERESQHESRTPREELEELREELAEERTQRLVAEAIANERARALERADATIRALTARITGVSSAESNGHTTGGIPPLTRPRWWKAMNPPPDR